MAHLDQSVHYEQRCVAANSRLGTRHTGGNFSRLGAIRGDGDYALTVFGNAYKNQGGSSWGVFSDQRLKQDVRSYEPGLSEVLQLRPVRYRYRDGIKPNLTSKQEEFGFIAQEVQEVIPDAVVRDEDGYLMLKADPIHWAGINAIKELNQKLEEQRAENAELKRRLDRLEAELEQRR